MSAETGTVETSSAAPDLPPDVPASPCSPEAAEQLYRERIAPLMVADRASTCNECHLSGVDLGLFLRESPCATMACMVERELVDLETPEQSLVLQWIARADPANAAVTPEMIAEEHEGMLAWIEFSAQCNTEVCLPVANPCGGPPSANECDFPPVEDEPSQREFDDPGDCRDRTLEAMFAAKIYSWRSRCFPCHFTDDPGTKLSAPQWIEVGPCEEGSLVTMRNVLRDGLVDVEAPEQSLLLTKPLSVLLGGIYHGGGDKFETLDDATYLDFVAWVERVVDCVNPPPPVGEDP